MAYRHGRIHTNVEKYPAGVSTFSTFAPTTDAKSGLSTRPACRMDER
jgi:hypothetical protein